MVFPRNNKNFYTPAQHSASNSQTQANKHHTTAAVDNAAAQQTLMGQKKLMGVAEKKGSNTRALTSAQTIGDMRNALSHTHGRSQHISVPNARSEQNIRQSTQYGTNEASLKRTANGITAEIFWDEIVQPDPAITLQRLEQVYADPSLRPLFNKKITSSKSNFVVCAIDEWRFDILEWAYSKEELKPQFKALNETGFNIVQLTVKGNQIEFLEWIYNHDQLKPLFDCFKDEHWFLPELLANNRISLIEWIWNKNDLKNMLLTETRSDFPQLRPHHKNVKSILTSNTFTNLFMQCFLARDNQHLSNLIDWYIEKFAQDKTLRSILTKKLIEEKNIRTKKTNVVSMIQFIEKEQHDTPMGKTIYNKLSRLLEIDMQNSMIESQRASNETVFIEELEEKIFQFERLSIEFNKLVKPLQQSPIRYSQFEEKISTLEKNIQNALNYANLIKNQPIPLENRQNSLLEILNQKNVTIKNTLANLKLEIAKSKIELYSSKSTQVQEIVVTVSTEKTDSNHEKNESFEDIKKSFIEFLKFINHSESSKNDGWNEFLTKELINQKLLTTELNENSYGSQFIETFIFELNKKSEITAVDVHLIMQLDQIYDYYQDQIATPANANTTAKNGAKREDIFDGPIQKIEKLIESNERHDSIKSKINALKQKLTRELTEQEQLSVNRKKYYQKLVTDIKSLKEKLIADKEKLQTLKDNIFSIMEQKKITRFGAEIINQYFIEKSRNSSHIRILDRQLKSLELEKNGLYKKFIGAQLIATKRTRQLEKLQGLESRLANDDESSRNLGAERKTPISTTAPARHAPITDLALNSLAQNLSTIDAFSTPTAHIAQQDAEYSHDILSSLLNAYKEDNKPLVRDLINQYPGIVNQHNGDGYSLLFTAIEENNPGFITQNLLNHNCPVLLEITDANNFTYNAFHESWKKAHIPQYREAQHNLIDALEVYALTKNQKETLLNGKLAICLDIIQNKNEAKLQLIDSLSKLQALVDSEETFMSSYHYLNSRTFVSTDISNKQLLEQRKSMVRSSRQLLAQLNQADANSQSLLDEIIFNKVSLSLEFPILKDHFKNRSDLDSLLTNLTSSRLNQESIIIEAINIRVEEISEHLNTTLIPSLTY